MSNNKSSRKKLTVSALAPVLVWIIGGCYFLVFSFDIREPLTLDKFDPGPALLPKILGTALLVGGAFSMFRILTARQGQQDNQNGQGSAHIATAVLAFILLMPSLGFHISCSVFGMISMLLMKVSWWQALLSTTVIVVTIHLVFIELFMISLPSLSIERSLF